MFKTILLFIKAHTISTIVTATVVVSATIATPIVVENYKLDKEVKENLGMLVSSDFQSNSNKEVVNTENQEQPSETPTDNKKELTFTVKRIETNYDDGSELVEFVIVPSYDKDFSQWSKEEKEAYNEAIKESAEMTKEEHKKLMENEEQTIADKYRELQLEINSWSEYYNCGVGNIAYNSYTKKYKGTYYDGFERVLEGESTWSTEPHSIEIENTSAEEFRSTIYPIMLQTFKEAKKVEWFVQGEESNFKSILEKVYHLSD